MRLFFALWPDAQIRAELALHAAALAQRAGGHAVTPAALHMTLVFLGEVAPDSLERVHSAAVRVRAERVELTLDCVGAWRTNGIGWLAPSAVPAQLLDLSAQLRAALRSESVAFDAKAFKAHVTLVRKLTEPVAAMNVPPIRWQVDQFALMRSELSSIGARYACAGHWPLHPR